MRRGSCGGGIGYAAFNAAREYGHSGKAHWEGDILVRETWHLFKGHEIAITERLQFAGAGKSIRYSHEVKGPKGEPIQNEMTFDVS